MSTFVCALGATAMMTAGAAGDEDPSLVWDIVDDSDGVRLVPLSIDSGAVVGANLLGATGRAVSGFSNRPIQQSVWTTEAGSPGAAWVRVDFGDVDLASGTDTQRGSYIRITSLEDGAEQYLDARSLAEWENTSAYFNGDRVKIELMSAPNSTGTDRVRIDGVAVGGVSPRSICGLEDDRVVSNDPRVGRLMSDGCTTWLVGNQGSTFITAGHCNPRGGQVVQFNVPYSRETGGYVHPGPEDQYIVQHASVQKSGSNTHLGNDWGVFAVKKNTETGLTPFEAQGDSFQLVTERVPADGRPLRVTGYGITEYPVDPTLNGVQKTHVGSHRGYSGSRLVRHDVDTTGGNSGGPVIDETTGLVIAIHTNAGCGASGGTNYACDILNPDLQFALANPQGLAVPENVDVAMSAVPGVVDPSGGSVLGFEILAANGHEIVDVPHLVMTAGGEVSRTPMQPVGDGAYEIELPEMECGTEIEYYYELEYGGDVHVFPQHADVSPMRTVALDTLAIGFGDDFQTDKGWAAQGDWSRIAPEGDPVTDGDGSGTFYLGDGSGVLTSPALNVRDALGATVSTLVWANGGTLRVELSSDGGDTWVLADEVVSTDGWDIRTYQVIDYVTPRDSVKVRFTSDGTGRVGIDTFSMSSRLCTVNACPADVDGDGHVDFSDVQFFLTYFAEQDLRVDMNGDGMVNYSDVSSFLIRFSADCGK